MYSIHVISWISCQLSTNIIHKVLERNSMKGKLHKMQSFVFLSTTLYFFKITFAKILSKMEVEEGKEVRNRKKGLWFWFYVTCSDRIFPLLLFLYSGNKLCPFFFFFHLLSCEIAYCPKTAQAGSLLFSVFPEVVYATSSCWPLRNA